MTHTAVIIATVLASASPSPAIDPKERAAIVSGSVLLGLGIGAFAAAIPLHVRSARARDKWWDATLTSPGPTGFVDMPWSASRMARDESRRASTATGWAYGAAVVGITAGTTLLTFGLLRRRARLSVQGWGTQRGGVVALRGRF